MAMSFAFLVPHPSACVFAPPPPFAFLFLQPSAFGFPFLHSHFLFCGCGVWRPSPPKIHLCQWFLICSEAIRVDFKSFIFLARHFRRFSFTSVNGFLRSLCCSFWPLITQSTE